MLLHTTYLPDTSSILQLLLLVILCVGVVIVIRREKSSSGRAGNVLCKLSNMSRGSIVAFLGFRPYCNFPRTRTKPARRVSVFCDFLSTPHAHTINTLLYSIRIACEAIHFNVVVIKP